MINVLKKIFLLIFVALVTGIGFAILIGPVCALCAFLGNWGRVFNSLLTGILMGYVTGIIIGSVWFLIKEFKK